MTSRNNKPEGTQLARITSTPDICGGRACIEGHRIRVADIVIWHEHEGLTPDTIVSQFPGLTLADVHAALAYYYENIDSIREEIRAELIVMDAARAANRSVLQGRLSDASRLS